MGIIPAIHSRWSDHVDVWIQRRKLRQHKFFEFFKQYGKLHLDVVHLRNL